MGALLILDQPRLSNHSLDERGDSCYFIYFVHDKEREREREREKARAQTPLSLQSTAENFVSVLEQTPAWSNFTKDKVSALATVLLESVESTTLAALLKSSANGSQTIQTEHLGRTYPSRQGHTWVLTLRSDFGDVILHDFLMYCFPKCFKPLNPQQSKFNHINNISPGLSAGRCVKSVLPGTAFGQVCVESLLYFRC